MSILSKAKSAVKSYAKNVVGGAKIVGGAISKALNTNASTQIAAPISALPSSFNTNQTLAPNISTNQGIGQVQSDGSVVLLSGQGRPTGGVIAPSGVGSTRAPNQTSLPSPIYSAPVSIFGGQSRSSGGSVLGASTSSFSSAPVSSNFSSSAINSSSLSSSANPISLPSAPTYADVGQINNGGLISALSDSYTYNPETNSFTQAQQVVQNPQNAQEEQKKRNALYEDLFKMIPEKGSVYDDPAVIKQQEEVRRRQQEVANYTAQLNSVVAQQNADLLRLRGVGSQEGVTETVYGGQAATINREAAIKALPIQAQLSAAQGNLGLAQDYLTQLTTFKQEQINSEYQYRKDLYASISDYVKGEEKRRLDTLDKQTDRAYERVSKNIEYQHQLASKAIEKGVPGLISRINAVNPSSSNFEQEVARVASGIVAPKPVPGTPGAGVLASLPTSIQTKLISSAESFGSSDIVKKYNASVDAMNVVNGVNSKSKNPADHQAVVYAFAKALDPESVVREGEYETIKKYAQSATQRYGKEIQNAIKGTGFLSERAIKNIQTTITNLNTSRKPQYDKAYSERSRIINNIAGADVAGEILIDYSPTQNTAPLAPGSSGQTSSGLKFQILP